MHRFVTVCSILALSALPSLAAEPVTVTQLLSTRTTPAGQPIVLPQRDVQLIVSRYVIAPGATLPTHMHPWERYGYVLSGHLQVKLTDTGQVLDYKQGDFIVEVSNTWHYGTVVGTEPVVLLVIDQVEAGHGNTVLKTAPGGQPPGRK
jgi:quercetin dioxygenase-like cupin family protein